jgi:hypothetical protein
MPKFRVMCSETVWYVLRLKPTAEEAREYGGDRYGGSWRAYDGANFEIDKYCPGANSMNLTQIKAEILTGTFDNAELQELMETVQYARAQLGKTVKRQLQPGVSVSFVSNRSGQRVLGTVERVAIKNIVVRTHLGLYRVPANMIEVV